MDMGAQLPQGATVSGSIAEPVYYLTAGNVLVYTTEYAIVDDRPVKAKCYRAGTHGFHGWLWVRNLTRVEVH